MKLRFSSLRAPAPSANHARERSPWIRAGGLPQVCAVLMLAGGMTGLVNEASAAPKPKATPTPTATPAPTPTPTPAPSPTATPEASVAASPAPTANYSGTQQMQYISTARDAFVALRTAKSQPFLDAHKEMDAAGGLSAKGLKTKADIAGRRELITKTSAANEEYLAFIKTQEDTYRAELAKTPLIPNDVDGLVKEFAAHTNTPTIIKLREDERDVLKVGDDSMAYLDKKFGAWSVGDTGKITFKKSADASAYGKLIAQQSAKVAEIDKLRAELSPTPAPSPSTSPATSPTGAPVASPTAAPAASAKP